MRAWFAALPVHRKLTVMALIVSAVALAAAVAGLVAFDAARFRASAVNDAEGVARVLADNLAAAIVFSDVDAAQKTLDSVRALPAVSLACVYRTDGSLMTSVVRSGGCPAQPEPGGGWRAVSALAAVKRNDVSVGAVFVERSLSDLPGRVAVTATAGALMLVLASVLAFVLARTLQRVISRPIADLARAARAIGTDDRYEMPEIPAPQDETGELVRAFDDMVHRLLSANNALRLEVDERRRMQAEREGLLAREREASRLKDEFLAAVSHELRTPLNAILGWTQILARTTPTEETTARAVASLSRNAQAQARVIEDLLDVSRIITGKLQMTLRAADLRAIVESAVEVVAPMAAARSVRLEQRARPAPCIVHADYDRMRQVIWNLVSNAVKFTGPGGTVTVETAEDRGAYTVTVRDTGAGIAPGFLPHVFERFRQADGSTTREHSGLGLGLAIVKELTELHGGTVSAASEGLGRGATFTVRIPVFVNASMESLSSAAPIRPQAKLRDVRALVVDDNPDALEVAAAVLEAAGAHVTIASSGEDAIERFSRGRPDIVLCDLAMPKSDGFAVLRRIREMDARDGSRTPVFAVTAYASDEYRARCAAAGFDGHIAKPYDAGEMIQLVASALQRA